MAAAQQLLDRARIPLNDADKARYTDTVLLEYLNEGLQWLRRERPDLFMGALNKPLATLATDTDVPLGAQWHAPLADYVSARAQTVDADAADPNGRAAAFFTLSRAGF